MPIYQKRSNRKPTGGRYKKLKVRRQHETGGLPALTKVDNPRTKTTRTIGGGKKHKLLATNTINIHKGNKVVKATIQGVVENPANRHFIRRNIITKGAIVQTDKGLARVTSRPGQVNSLMGVAVE